MMCIIKKTTLIIILLLTVGAITSCKSDKFEVEPLNIKIIDDTNPAFNFSVAKYVEQYNKYYEKDYGVKYLVPTPAKDDDSYGFKEDEKIFSLPELGISSKGSDNKVRQITITFDWHSYSDALIKKHENMSFYALKVVLPDMKDNEIKEIYSKAMDIGYNNPRDEWYNQNAVPYALFYKGNVGIYTYFSLGQSQFFCIIPVTKNELKEYLNKDVKLFEVKKKMITSVKIL